MLVESLRRSGKVGLSDAIFDANRLHGDPTLPFFVMKADTFCHFLLELLVSDPFTLVYIIAAKPCVSVF
jgi:hypothetical protein